MMKKTGLVIVSILFMTMFVHGQSEDFWRSLTMMDIEPAEMKEAAVRQVSLNYPGVPQGTKRAVGLWVDVIFNFKANQFFTVMRALHDKDKSEDLKELEHDLWSFIGTQRYNYTRLIQTRCVLGDVHLKQYIDALIILHHALKEYAVGVRELLEVEYA